MDVAQQLDRAGVLARHPEFAAELADFFTGRDLLDRMGGNWVISTLHAFRVDPARLQALRHAGARIAYGTDLGNEDTAPGIDARELALLAKAGIDPLKAATQQSAELLGLRDLGRLSVGSAASLIAVRDLAPESLARPAWVMIDGKMVV